MSLAGTPHPIWDSRRLWSLADMINFYLYNFATGQQMLRQALQTAEAGVASRQYEVVPPAEHERLATEIREAIKWCVESISLYEAGNTAIEIENMLGSYLHQDYNWQELHTLLTRMRDQIEREIQAECFFHYSREDARLVSQIPRDWAPVITSFPSARKEIEAALDCSAFGDHAGCIFHMMGVAEMGLRSIARERGITKVGKNKPIEFAMWVEILRDVHGAVDRIRTAKIINSTTRAKKEIASQFYSTILGDIQALLPLRDQTFHFRGQCDRGQGQTAVIRVKSLMGTIATKLSETDGRKIAWGFRL